MCDTVGHVIAGRMDGVSLNEEGKEQVARSAERLGRIDHIYTSPLDRAVETARIISARSGAEVSIIEALNEIEFGDWTGKKISDLDTIDQWRQFNTRRSVTRIPRG